MNDGDTTDIAKEYSDFTLDDFISVTESKKPFDIYGDCASIIEDFNGGVRLNYEVNVRRLCCIFKLLNEAFLKNAKNNHIIFLK